MTAAPVPNRRKRPFGVNALIVIQFCSMLLSAGVLIFYLAALSGALEQAIVELGLDEAAATLPASTTETGTTPGTLSEALSPDALNIGFPELVQLTFEVVLSAVTLYGLWGMRRWAWYLVMLSLGLSMTIDLWQYFFDEPNYWSMFFSVIMVFYLNQREVQQAFARRKPHAAAAAATAATS